MDTSVCFGLIGMYGCFCYGFFVFYVIYMYMNEDIMILKYIKNLRINKRKGEVNLKISF